MPFSHITNSNKRSVLTLALEEYRHENAIQAASREHKDAGELMIHLYQNGHRTVAHLKAAAVATIRRKHQPAGGRLCSSLRRIGEARPRAGLSHLPDADRRRSAVVCVTKAGGVGGNCRNSFLREELEWLYT